jgi:hypothetical protein
MWESQVIGTYGTMFIPPTTALSETKAYSRLKAHEQSSTIRANQIVGQQNRFKVSLTMSVLQREGGHHDNLPCGPLRSSLSSPIGGHRPSGTFPSFILVSSRGFLTVRSAPHRTAEISPEHVTFTDQRADRGGPTSPTRGIHQTRLSYWIPHSWRYR